jgi:RHS repeat-associated protein
MIRTLSPAVAIALFLCGGAARSQDGPTTPSGAGTSGSPNDECCPPRQSIAPFEPRGGLMMTAEVTVRPDGEMSVAVEDPMTVTMMGLSGVGRLYAAQTARHANTLGEYGAVLDELDCFVPFPGRIVLMPEIKDDTSGENPPPTQCDDGMEDKFPCEWMWVVTEENGVTTTEWKCVCAPVQVGGGGAGTGATPARFLQRLGQKTGMPTMPLVFGSDLTGATLWLHNFWDPQTRYMEIKHVDGTIAIFEYAQSVQTVDAWRLKAVVDPYDNRADYIYDGQGRLDEVHYPTGICEVWTYANAPTGWTADHSSVIVTYEDPLDSSVDLSAHTWGIVFQNVGSKTHFHGKVLRYEYPASKFVEPSVGASGFEYFDVEATAPVSARQVLVILYDTSGRIGGLGEARSWGPLLTYFPPTGDSTSTAIEATTTLTYVPTAEKVERIAHPLLGGRYHEFEYGLTPTRSVSGVSMTRTVRRDASGNLVHFEFDAANQRIYRIDQEAADNAVDRPRKYESGNVQSALSAHFEEEPARIRTDYDYGAACGCSKPTRVEVSGLDAASQVLESRVREFVYDPATGLVTQATVPNPSTAPGAPATVTTTYAYESAVSPGTIEWSATVLSSVTTPDGTFDFDYVWRDRGDVPGHGRMPQRITRSIPSVRVQTDFGATSTTTVQWVTDLGYVSPAYPTNAPTRLNGQPAVVVDGDGVTSTMTYDAHGHLVSVTAGDVKTGIGVTVGGLLTSLTQNDDSPSHEIALTIDQDARGGVHGVSTQIGQVQIESENYYDRWGNPAVVRRKNVASDGQPPQDFQQTSSNARGWVENQALYQWTDLIAAYVDRRPLDMPRGAPFSLDPLAWFQVTEYDYRVDGRIEKVTHPNGAETAYAIDGYGVPYTSVTSVSGGGSFQHPRVFTNSLLEIVAQWQGGTGAGDSSLWTVLSRNGAGAVVSMTEPQIASALVPTVYSGSLGGAVHAFELDELGRVVRASSSSLGTTLVDVAKAYDQLGRVIREERQAILSGGTVLPGASHVSIWRYADQKASQIAFAKATGHPAAHVVDYGYELVGGRLESITDSLGNSRSLEYHPGTDYVKAVVRHVIDGAGPGSVDYRTEYAVDPLGQVTEIEDRGDGTVQSPEYLVHHLAYNSLGMTDRYVDPMGREQVYLPDALGRLIEHVRVRGPSATSDPRTVTIYMDYGGVGSSLVRRTDGMGRVSATRYDYLGRPVAQQNPGSPYEPYSGSKNVPFSYYLEYDPLLSRLTDVYDGDNGHAKLWYNGPGHLIQREIVNATGSAQALISAFNVRDIINRDALGRILNTGAFAVDGAGNYSINVLESFDFDSLGRTHSEAFLPFGLGNVLQVQSSYTGGATFRTGLDYLDNLPSGSTPLSMSLTPDDIGRLELVRWNQAPGSGGSLVDLASYSYLGAQKRTRQLTVVPGTPPAVADSFFDYDEFGRLSEIRDTLTGVTGDISKYGYFYDKASNLLKEVYDKHATTAPDLDEGDRFAYDDFHRLSVAWLGLNGAGMTALEPTLLAGGVGDFIQKVTYGLDDANNRSLVRTQNGPSGTPSDDVYQVQDATHPQGPSNRYEVAGSAAPLYDNRGNTRFDGQRYYVYDYLNRLSEVYYVVPEEPVEPMTMTAATADTWYGVTDVGVLERARGEIMRRMDGGDLRRLMRRMRDPAFRAGMKQSVRGGVVQLSRGGLFGPTSDAEPQLMLVAVYNYDLFNRRTARIIIGIDTYVYAWDGWREVQEASWSVSGSVPRQQYVWGDTLDELLAYRNLSGGTATTYFMTQGGQDTPARLIDSTGTVVQKYEYDAYGKATVITLGMGGYLNPYRWKGMRYDPETGLGYRRNRYYSFEWGRFMTLDPLGMWADGFNWGNGYAYVGNNGLTRWDPLGHQAMVVIARDATTDHPDNPGDDLRVFHEFADQIVQEEGGGTIVEIPAISGLESWRTRETGDAEENCNILQKYTRVVVFVHGGLDAMRTRNPSDPDGWVGSTSWTVQIDKILDWTVDMGAKDVTVVQCYGAAGWTPADGETNPDLSNEEVRKLHVPTAIADAGGTDVKAFRGPTVLNRYKERNDAELGSEQYKYKVKHRSTTSVDLLEGAPKTREARGVFKKWVGVIKPRTR